MMIEVSESTELSGVNVRVYVMPDFCTSVSSEVRESSVTLPATNCESSMVSPVVYYPITPPESS